jgi:hypothetical protein
MAKRQVIKIQPLINLAINLNSKVEKKNDNTLGNIRRIAAQLLYGVKLVNTKGVNAQEFEPSFNFGNLLTEAVEKAKKIVVNTPDKATAQAQQVANYVGLSKDFGSRYNYLGAGTNLSKNIKGSKVPINDLDRVAMIHDFNYLVASSLTGEERAKYLKETDQLFLDQTRDLANNSPDPSVKADAKKANQAFGFAVYLNITDSFVGKGTKLSNEDVRNSLIYAKHQLSKLFLDKKVIDDIVLQSDVQHALDYYNDQSLKYEAGETELEPNIHDFRHVVSNSNYVVPSIILPTLSIEASQGPLMATKRITTKGGKPSEAAAVEQEERKDPEYLPVKHELYGPFEKQLEIEREQDIKNDKLTYEKIRDIVRIYGITLVPTSRQIIPKFNETENKNYNIIFNKDAINSKVGLLGLFNGVKKIIETNGFAKPNDLQYMITLYDNNRFKDFTTATDLDKVQKLGALYGVDVKINNRLRNNLYNFKGHAGTKTEFVYNPRLKDAAKVLEGLIHQRGLSKSEYVVLEGGISEDKLVNSDEVVRYTKPQVEPSPPKPQTHAELVEKERELFKARKEEEEEEKKEESHALVLEDKPKIDISGLGLPPKEEKELHSKLQHKEAIEHKLLEEFLKDVTEKRQSTLLPGARLTGDLEKNVDVLQGKTPGLFFPQIPKTGQRNLGLQIAIGSGSLLKRSAEQERANREWYKNFRVVPLGHANGNQDFIADPSMKTNNTLITAVNDNMKMRFSGPLFNPAKLPYKQTKAAQPSARALIEKRPELRNQCQGFQVMWNQAQPIREPGKPIQMARQVNDPFATSHQNMNSLKTRLYHPNIIIQPDGKIVRI